MRLAVHDLPLLYLMVWLVESRYMYLSFSSYSEWRSCLFMCGSHPLFAGGCAVSGGTWPHQALWTAVQELHAENSHTLSLPLISKPQVWLAVCQMISVGCRTNVFSLTKVYCVYHCFTCVMSDVITYDAEKAYDHTQLHIVLLENGLTLIHCHYLFTLLD